LNQNPEQIARDNIDKQLIACGWIVQDKSKSNISAGLLARTPGVVLTKKV
jgi:type I restriction enzyme R subunit